MKTVFIMVIIFLAFTKLEAQEAGVGELFIYLIDTPANFNITLTVTPETPTYWDAYTYTSDHFISTDYAGGNVLLDQSDGGYGIDFCWDPSGYITIGLGLYKISIANGETAEVFYFDMRTSDVPECLLGADFTVDYSINNKEFLYEDEVINNDTLLYWNIRTSCQKITEDLEPYAPVNLSSTSQNNRPKLTWERHNPPDDYIVNYKIYRRIDSNPIEYLGSTTNLFYIDYNVSVGKGYVAHYTVKAVNGNKSASSSIDVDISGFVKQATSDDNGIIDFNKLHQNYPNPFNPNTVINYSVKNDGFVRLRVYDILGKEVALLVNENLPAGEYQVEFDGSNLESGVYFYEITAGDFKDVKKLLLLK